MANNKICGIYCVGGCGELRRIGPKFNIDKRNGSPRTSCKVCWGKKKWINNNPDKYKTLRSKASLADHLKRRYGILSSEEFNLIFSRSNGLCEICNKAESRKGRRLSLDHNHDTGIVRGLLCSRCNLLIGNARDDIEFLLKAVAYLQKYQNNDLFRPTVGVRFLPGFKNEEAVS